MKLRLGVARYLEFKQSLGMRFETAGYTLRAFCRAMGSIDLGCVKPDKVAAFLLCNGQMTSGWHYKRIILNGFYRFAINRGLVRACPLPTVIPKYPPVMSPYIYTTRELQSLLDATSSLNNPQNPFRGQVFRALLLTLYGTGIRIGEAVKLTFADVDIENSVLTIRDGKFHKTRMVPVGPRLRIVLRDYLQEWRDRFHDDSAMIFPLAQGATPSRICAEYMFRRLREKVNIHRESGTHFQPRLHDIRHTAAVHRLVAWYRQGADVQRLLPQLSVYLGHVHLSGTQHYLTMTPELLKLANRRFELYAFSEVSHV